MTCCSNVPFVLCCIASLGVYVSPLLNFFYLSMSAPQLLPSTLQAAWTHHLPLLPVTDARFWDEATKAANSGYAKQNIRSCAIGLMRTYCSVHPKTEKDKEQSNDETYCRHVESAINSGTFLAALGFASVAATISSGHASSGTRAR